MERPCLASHHGASYRLSLSKIISDLMMVQPGQDRDGDNGAGPLDRAPQAPELPVDLPCREGLSRTCAPREISVSVGVRGGAGRTRTGNQTVISPTGQSSESGADKHGIEDWSQKGLAFCCEPSGSVVVLG